MSTFAGLNHPELDHSTVGFGPLEVTGLHGAGLSKQPMPRSTPRLPTGSSFDMQHYTGYGPGPDLQHLVSSAASSEIFDHQNAHHGALHAPHYFNPARRSMMPPSLQTAASYDGGSLDGAHTWSEPPGLVEDLGMDSSSMESFGSDTSRGSLEASSSGHFPQQSSSSSPDSNTDASARLAASREMANRHILGPSPRKPTAPLLSNGSDSGWRPESSGQTYNSSPQPQISTPRSMSESPPPENVREYRPHLSKDEKLLLHLREECGMSWKDTAAYFESELGKSYRVPALQMRYRRLKARMQFSPDDKNAIALRQAHKFWKREKWRIIAGKMSEYGATDSLNDAECHRKWKQMKLHDLEQNQQYEA